MSIANQNLAYSIKNIIKITIYIIDIRSIEQQIELESCPEIKNKTSTYDW